MRARRLLHSEPAPASRAGPAQVLALAWPLMISMLSQTAMSMADVLYVSRLGTTPLAGIGLGSVAGFLLLSAGFGLTGGVRVLVAQATGAGRHRQARVLAWQGLWLALVLGLVGLVLAPAAHLLIRGFGASPEVSEQGARYLAWGLGGAGATLATLALTSWFQGRGDTRTPMVVAVLSNLLNIAMDPVLIFGLGPVPALGIDGAAASTVLAQVLSALALAALVRRHLRGSSPWPRRDLLRRALQVGAPMAINGVLSVAGFAVFVGVLARAGDAHLGAHVIVMRIVSLSFLPGHAVGEAAGVLVGQALGARRPRLARQAFGSAVRVALAIMGTMSVVFLVAPRPLVAAFHPAPEVMHIALQLMVVGAAFQVFDAVAMVAQGTLNGAGDTRYTLLVGVGAMWLVDLPLGWLLALHLHLGALGAWLALTAEILTYASLTVWRVRRLAWLRQGLSRAAQDAAASAHSDPEHSDPEGAVPMPA